MTRSNNDVSPLPRLATVGLSLIFAALLVSNWVSRSSSAQNTAQSKKPPATNSDVQYTAAGELILPENFTDWVFVGSNLGLEYREADQPPPAENKNSDDNLKKANFHNVYINPSAYADFQRTGKFPEKTVFVLDIYRAEPGEPKSVVSQGLFPGKRKEIAVAVKNSQRPDGSKTDWAYYDFPLGQKSAKAFADKACYDCHLQHADKDNVWVQFYPILRDKSENFPK